MKVPKKEVCDMSDDKMTAGSAARRRITARELAIWRSLLDTTADLHKVMSAQLQESGLSSGDYQVLLALKEADGFRLRSSELAATIESERSRLSHHLGRMEQRGLIRREDCATDNRGAEILLTENGMAVFRPGVTPHLRGIKKHLVDALTPEQLKAHADVLQWLQQPVHVDVIAGLTGETHR